MKRMPRRGGIFVYEGNKSDFLKTKNTISIMANKKSNLKV